MFKCACFCGAIFDSDDPLAYCPDCSVPAALPTGDDRIAEQMSAELQRLLEDPLAED